MYFYSLPFTTDFKANKNPYSFRYNMELAMLACISYFILTFLMGINLNIACNHRSQLLNGNLILSPLAFILVLEQSTDNQLTISILQKKPSHSILIIFQIFKLEKPIRTLVQYPKICDPLAIKPISKYSVNVTV